MKLIIIDRAKGCKAWPKYFPSGSHYRDACSLFVEPATRFNDVPLSLRPCATDRVIIYVHYSALERTAGARLKTLNSFLGDSKWGATPRAAIVVQEGGFQTAPENEYSESWDPYVHLSRLSFSSHPSDVDDIPDKHRKSFDERLARCLDLLDESEWKASNLRRIMLEFENCIRPIRDVVNPSDLVVGDGIARQKSPVHIADVFYQLYLLALFARVGTPRALDGELWKSLRGEIPDDVWQERVAGYMDKCQTGPVWEHIGNSEYLAELIAVLCRAARGRHD